MGQPDNAHAELVKDAQQIQIRGKRFGALHRDEQGDLVGLARANDLVVSFADGKIRRLIDLAIESSDLIDPDTERHLRQVSVFDVNGRADNADPSGAQLTQIIGGEHVGAAALLVKVHEHVEMKIDNSPSVQPLDPFLS